MAADSEPLTAAELLQVVKRLPESLPITDVYEASDRAERARKDVSYWSQRQHIARWLAEYNSPGFYGRKTSGRDAKFFYNHFKCVAGLIWLAEAVGIPSATLRDGVIAVGAGSRNPASECGAFRKVVPWSSLERRLRERSI